MEKYRLYLFRSPGLGSREHRRPGRKQAGRPRFLGLGVMNEYYLNGMDIVSSASFGRFFLNSVVTPSVQRNTANMPSLKNVTK